MPQYKVLNSLTQQNFLLFSDDEYKNKTLEIIKYAENGEYFLADYLTVMYCSERLNNILNLNLKEIRDKLIIGLKLSLEKMTKINELIFSQFKMSGKTTEMSEYNNEIYRIGLNEIKALRFKERKVKIKDILSLLTTNYEEFLIKYNTDGEFYSINHYLFFDYITPELFLEKIKNSNNGTFYFLTDFFKNNCSDLNLIENYDNFDKFTNLFSEFRYNFNKEDNKIKFYLIDELATTLITIRDNIKN